MSGVKSDAALRALRADAASLVAAFSRGIGLEDVLDSLLEEDGEARYASWREGAEACIPEACFLVGACCEYGALDVEPDPEAALAWYRVAADADHPLGHFACGQCAWVGIGMTRDDELAISAFLRAAEQGLAVAQCRLALALQGIPGSDPWIAVGWLERAAAGGNAEAMCHLGLAFEEGEGVDTDAKVAVEWYLKSADAGFAYALYCLGECHADGIGVEPDPVTAAEWFQRGADADDPSCQYALGLAWLEGQGVDEDPSRAAAWFLRAADHGMAEPALELAYLYREGLGVEADPELAFEWLLAAAERGSYTAVYDVGVAYARGDGVGADLEAAAEWLRRAAELGVQGAEEARMAVLGQLTGGDPDAALAALAESFARGAPAAELRERAAALLGSAEDGGPEFMARAMELALVHVGDPDPARAAVAAVVCGGLVEEGADGRGALVPVASRLLRLLADAAEAEDWDDPGWMALDWFYRPVVAILSRERDLAETPQAMALSEPAELLASEHPGMAHLYRLLRVADVPLLVIDPVSVKGWRVLTRGISDNFQLHVLLLDLFADELGLEPPPGEVVRTALGDGPQETAAVVSGAWDLLAWSAIGEDGALPDVVDEVHWVWNEQVPGDIPEFGGERVLLLGPASCERTWNNARTFEALGAEVSVVERLELGRVAERLARMARRRA